jgi:hypothetical protein
MDRRLNTKQHTRCSVGGGRYTLAAFDNSLLHRVGAMSSMKLEIKTYTIPKGGAVSQVGFRKIARQPRRRGRGLSDKVTGLGPRTYQTPHQLPNLWSSAHVVNEEMLTASVADVVTHVVPTPEGCCARATVEADHSTDR